MDPKVNGEWWKLFFNTGGTSIGKLDSEMCFAAIRPRECPGVGHTKAEGVELEGVYPAGGSWRYHKIQCYLFLGIQSYLFLYFYWSDNYRFQVRSFEFGGSQYCHLDCVVVPYRELPESTADDKIACVRHW